MLEIKDLHVHYGNIHALKGVSLVVDEGEIVCLIGANGAGKTTTLMTICGVLRPSAGEIRLDGNSLVGLPPEQIVRAGISLVPEGRRVFPELTVLENLRAGAYARPDRGRLDADLERVFTLFPRLKERQRQLGGTLSGGEQQMLSVGRALMGKPKLLLLDEPSLGLAPLLVESIMETIAAINQQGTSVLLVEQNALAALNLADRGYVLETGRVAYQGKAKDLLDSPEIRRAYIGG